MWQAQAGEHAGDVDKKKDQGERGLHVEIFVPVLSWKESMRLTGDELMSIGTILNCVCLPQYLAVVLKQYSLHFSCENIKPERLSNLTGSHRDDIQQI